MVGNTSDPSDSYVKDVENARQAKISELYLEKPVSDLASSIESWTSIKSSVILTFSFGGGEAGRVRY